MIKPINVETALRNITQGIPPLLEKIPKMARRSSITGKSTRDTDDSDSRRYVTVYLREASIVFNATIGSAIVSTPVSSVVKAISARMSSMAVASAVCAVGAIGESHCERKKSQK